jgi:hypothetical protein
MASIFFMTHLLKPADNIGAVNPHRCARSLRSTGTRNRHGSGQVIDFGLLKNSTEKTARIPAKAPVRIC